MGSYSCTLTMTSLVLLFISWVVAGRTENRQLSYCCGQVRTKCAAGCADAAYNVQCSGRCGLLNTLCGPYTCSSVTNACTSEGSTPTPLPSPTPTPTPTP